MFHLYCFSIIPICCSARISCDKTFTVSDVYKRKCFNVHSAEHFKHLVSNLDISSLTKIKNYGHSCASYYYIYSVNTVKN